VGIVRQYIVSARLLNIVNFDSEVVAIGNTQASGDVKLLQTLADVLQFRVRHLRVKLVAERSSYKEQDWHHFRLFVKTAQVSTASILVMFFAKFKLKLAIVHLFLN